MLPIEICGLKKSYGAIEALKGITFSVGDGEIFGLLGPNGAGKTSAIEILEGRLKDRVGVCLQATNLPDKMRVHEALRLFGELHSRTLDQAALLRRLQLWEKRDSFFQHLSGGQKQRLALALALVNDPQVIFLDEPSLAEPLVQQTVTRGLLDATRDALASKSFADRTNGRDFQALLTQGKANLVAAWKAGVPLAMGTDAGNTLVFHGPSMHRELQLWVEAGIPADVALAAATSGGAKALRADGRIGYLRKGYEANMLLVEGNPLKDISATQHISLVVFKGERLSRSELFKDE